MSEYQLSVKAIPDVTQVQGSLDKHSFSLKTQVDTKDIVNQATSAFKVVQRQLKDVKIKVKLMDGSYMYDHGTKVTETLKSISGETTKISAVFDDLGERVGDVTTTSTTNIEKLESAIKTQSTTVKNYSKMVTDSANSNKQYNASVEETITRTKTYSGDIQTLITRVATYRNEMGKLITETKTYNKDAITGAETQVGTTMRNVSDTIVRENQSSIQSKVKYNGYDAVQTVNKTSTMDSSGNFTTNKKVITEYTNSMGKAVKITEEFDGTSKKAIKTTKEVTSGLGKETTQTKSLGQSFGNVITKVAKFYLATLPIQAVTKMISKAKEAVMDLDSAFTELQKVSNLSGSSLQSYGNTLAKIGVEVGRTKTEMVESATTFIKTGATEEEAQQLAKVAEMYRNVADEELSSADASSFMVSQMRAFNIEASDTMRIIDGVNEVAANYAVSTEDLRTALEKSGNALGTAGNSYEQTIALITGAEEILQGQSSRVGMGLRTISINLTKLASETKGTTAKVAGLDVKLKDENGTLMNTYDIMTNLAPTWQELTAEQKTNLAMTIAGKNRYDVFVATMNNISQATASYTTALNSQGSAEKQNSDYMEHLQAKLTALEAEFENFVTGNNGLATVASFFLDIAKGVLTVVNAFGGLQTTIWLLVTAFAVLKRDAIVKLFDKTLPNMLSNAKLTFSMFFSTVQTEAITTGTVINSALGIVGLIGTAISVVIGIVSDIGNSAETASDKVKTLSDRLSELSDARSAVKEAESALDSINKKIASINKLKIIDDSQIKKLKQEKALAEADLLIAKQKQKIKQQEAETTALAKLKKTPDFNTYVNVSDENYGVDDTLVKQTKKQRLNDLWEQKTLNSNAKRPEETGIYKVDTFNINVVGMQQYADEIQKINDLEKQQGTLSEEDNKKRDEYIKQYDKLAKKTNTTAESLQGILEVLPKNSTEYKTVKEALDGYSVSVTGATLAEQEEVETLDDLNEEIQESIEKTSKKIDTLQSSVSTVTTAISDYNTDGHISIDNLQSLIALKPKYLNLLTLENGKLKLNEKQASKMLEQQKEKMKADIYENTVKQLAIIASTNYSSAKITESEVENADTLVKQGNTQAIYNQLKAKIANYSFNEGQAKQAQKLINTSLKQIALIDEMGTQWGDDTSATEKNSNAKKKLQARINALNLAKKEEKQKLKDSKNALEEEKDKIEEELDDYDTLYDALEYFTNQRIDQLQDEIDAWEDAHDRIVDGLEDEKDTWEDYYEDKISALEYENAETERQIELQEKQEALAKAMSTQKRVFKNGTYQTVTDENAVASAKKELENTKKQQKIEEEKEALEKEKTKTINDIEEKIKEQDTYYEALEDGNQAMIDELEAFLDKLDILKNLPTTKKYKKLLDEYGITITGKNGKLFGSTLKEQTKITDNILDKMKSIEKNRENLKDQLEGLNKAIKALTKKINGLDSNPKFNTKPLEKKLNALKSSTDSSGKSTSKIATITNDLLKLLKKGITVKVNAKSNSKSKKTVTDTKVNKVYTNDNTIYGVGNNTGRIFTGNVATGWITTTGAKIDEDGNYVITSNGKTIATISKKAKLTDAEKIAIYNNLNSKYGITVADLVKKYAKYVTVAKNATGNYSVDEDTMSLIGDSPNQELVIGSKLNGSLTKLQKGTGVVNAKSTKTFAGLVNMLSASATNFGNGNTSTPNSTISNGMSVVINTLNLPQVTNGSDFVQYLKNFEMDMTQKAYTN